MLNTTIYREHPDVQTIAEESSAWPQVSRPVHTGGLGFGLKWDLGWMHDTLRYLKRP
jgi:1,4-alpha-glucan branching enzyme